MHINYLTIIGCSGHGKVVLDALELSDSNFSITLCDDNPALLGKIIAGYTVMQTIVPLSDINGNVHIAIGNNLIRKKLYQALSQTSLLTIIHPNAVISPRAHVAGGCFIAAQAILAPECTIHEGCIINHAAIIDHEVSIGAYSHVAPNSTLGGNVKIGSGVLIGAGATILPGIQIGDGVTIGAGSVVTRDVAKNSIIKGVPAK